MLLSLTCNRYHSYTLSLFENNVIVKMVTMKPYQRILLFEDNCYVLSLF